MFDKEKSRRECECMKRDIPITEYAASLGFTLVRKGKYISTKEHDSLMIDPESNTYRQFSVSPRSKSIIDFSMHFENKSLDVAIRDLMAMWKQQNHLLPEEARPRPKPLPPKEKVKVEFSLPERDNDHKRAYAYLTKTRQTDPEIVKDFLHRRLLYQEKEHKNCVFVGYNAQEKPVFGCLRGTSTGQRFVRDIDGSDYRQGMYLDHGQNTLVVTESAIDCMSVMSLTRMRGNDPKQCDYLALSGVSKLPTLFEQLKAHPRINRVLLALDYDNAGLEASCNIRDALKSMNFSGTVVDAFPKLKKDWNEELQYIKTHHFRPDYFLPNQNQQAKLREFCHTRMQKKPFDQKQIMEFKQSRIPRDIFNALKNQSVPEDSDPEAAIEKMIERSIYQYNGGEEPESIQPKEPELLTMKIAKPKQTKRNQKREPDWER